MKIGIDASRNRSGGAIAHIVGVMDSIYAIEKFDVKEIHIWSHSRLLESISDRPWLVKHNPSYLEKNIFMQAFWQRFILRKELQRNQCSIVFNSSASSIGTFQPSVTLSQDMLPFEPGEMQRYRFGLGRLRLFFLKIMYINALKTSSAVIFLTNYAASMIQRVTGPIKNYAVIPHGVNDSFRNVSKHEFLKKDSTEIECIYVSGLAPYKHQWHVVRAIKILRDEGVSISLSLVGGGSGNSLKRLNKEIQISDPENIFVKQHPFIPISDIPNMLSKSDIFIFASSCENMPITLIEGMASGLPIACSDRGPMPEVLQDGGTFFNPESSESIKQAIYQIINDPILRQRTIKKSLNLSSEYQWSKCAEETIGFLTETCKKELKKT
jgi:glycosyltransferase involved in cell wall biosynthesis